MTDVEFKLKVREVARSITHPEVRELEHIYQRNRTLFSLVAEMIVRSSWDASKFLFFMDDGYICFGINGTGTANISGYNFAYQVKLITDLISEAGYFE